MGILDSILRSVPGNEYLGPNINLPGSPNNVTSPGGVPDIFQPGLFPFMISGTDPSIGQGWLDKASPLLSQFQGMQPPQLETDFSGLMSRAMPGMMQDVMNKLASRGMINSSVAGDTMSKTLTDLGTNIMGMSNQNETANQNAYMQHMGMFPSMLGAVGGLAGIGGGMGQYSLQANPLAPYETLSHFALNY